MPAPGLHSLSLLLMLFLSPLAAATYPSPPATSTLPSDAVALLSFKSKADIDSKLLYTLNERFDYCQWQGVKCAQGRVVRFVLLGFGLGGVFAPNTLTRLDQLRVLSIQNNSLTGPIPDLAALANLKTLFLNHNSFSGTFPGSLLSLHGLLVLDLSHNNFTGSIPAEISGLDRLSYLRLDSNHFEGAVPPLNQTALKIFNVSNNNLTGAIPVTHTLSQFSVGSFSWNPNLCGKIINKECRWTPPFFDSPSDATSSTQSPPLLQSAESQGVVLSPPASTNKHKRIGIVIGLVIGALILIAVILSLSALFRRQINHHNHSKPPILDREPANETDIDSAEAEPKEKRVEIAERRDRKSGDLIFCGGEAQMYSIEQLMRASAELLGRGTIGTTYKAVMDNRLIVTVKRLDAVRMAATSGEVFERHMEIVGGLRHPNLVTVRAYFQARDERLIVYDYQPNGSLFNLIHGSRSTRAKPLHWTSCLKIAEDVAQGLAYIHQASNLIHGNLKSTNVLLGTDFEARLSDYSLSVLADCSPTGDPNSDTSKAPETRKTDPRPSPRSDVYAFGVLLLEILSGKPPSHHPFLVPTEMLDWVRAVRGDDDNGEYDRLGMLVEVACICRLTSPEQRPAMWQVVKMIQEVKERIAVEDNTRNARNGYY